MKKPYPCYCKDCKWFIRVTNVREKHNMCTNPMINATDADSLSSIIPGVRCKYEREKMVFGLCGMRGKLWEAKEDECTTPQSEEK